MGNCSTKSIEIIEEDDIEKGKKRPSTSYYNRKLPKSVRTSNFTLDDEQEDIEIVRSESNDLKYQFISIFAGIHSLFSILVVLKLGLEVSEESHINNIYIDWIIAFITYLAIAVFAIPPATRSIMGLFLGKKPDKITFLTLAFVMFSGVGNAFLLGKHFGAINLIGEEEHNSSNEKMNIAVFTVNLFLRFFKYYWPAFIPSALMIPIACNYQFGRKSVIEKINFVKNSKVSSIFYLDGKKRKKIYKTAEMRDFIFYLLTTLGANINYRNKNKTKKIFEEIKSVFSKENTSKEKIIELMTVYKNLSKEMFDFHDDRWYKKLLNWVATILGFISAKYVTGPNYAGGHFIGSKIASSCHGNPELGGKVLGTITMSGAGPQAAIGQETTSHVFMAFYNIALMYFAHRKEIPDNWKSVMFLLKRFFAGILSTPSAGINAYIEMKYGSRNLAKILPLYVFFMTLSQGLYGYNKVLVAHESSPDYNQVLFQLDQLMREDVSQLSIDEIDEIVRESNLEELYKEHYPVSEKAPLINKETTYNGYNV